MGGFSNPVTNAIGTLVRTAMQSLGFLSGSTGWQIKRDGNAEFNQVIIRGSVLIGPIGGAHIFLDNTTGQITVIGAAGGKIVIDPNSTYPQLHFFSNDGTNDAFINAVSVPNSAVDIGINSGVYTPADTVNRRGRLYLQDSADNVELAVIQASNQQRKGGYLRFNSTQALLGLFNAATSDDSYVFVTTGQNIWIKNANLNVDKNLVLTAGTDVFMRVADIVNPLHFQGQQKCNAVTTVTATTDALVPGTSASYTTSIATCKYSVQLIADVIINNAGTTAVFTLYVDGVNTGDEAHFNAAAGGRVTCAQTFEGTVSPAGSHSFAMDARCAGAGSSFTANPTHTKLGVRLYE